MAFTSAKIGRLVIIIGLPILFIVVLQFFGKNHYELKTPPYYPNGLDGQSSQHFVPPFTLVNQSGNTYTLDSVKGKIVIADFIFTTCQTICPAMSTQMTRVQEAFKNNKKDIVILSHSIDPEHDTVGVLMEYAKKYGVDQGIWKLLTGKKEEIYKMAHKGYALSAVEDHTIKEGFIHSDKMVLVDRLGRIRGYYSGVDPLKVDTLILEAKVLLSQGN
jgi:protein SCO1/2